MFDKEEDECENDFERWIYVLKNMETLKRMPFKARKAVFEKLEEIADVASLSGEERVRYENSVNAYRTHLCVMDAAKLEGKEEGFAEGKEEGRKEGLTEGRLEERKVNARKMKAKGIDDDTISEITGFTLEEIANL